MKRIRLQDVAVKPIDCTSSLGSSSSARGGRTRSRAAPARRRRRGAGPPPSPMNARSPPRQRSWPDLVRSLHDPSPWGSAWPRHDRAAPDFRSRSAQTAPGPRRPRLLQRRLSQASHDGRPRGPPVRHRPILPDRRGPWRPRRRLRQGARRREARGESRFSGAGRPLWRNEPGRRGGRRRRRTSAFYRGERRSGGLEPCASLGQ